MKLEVRCQGSLELRESSEGRTLCGYAARFNSDSKDLGGFIERIMPGCFARALKENQEVRALVNHRMDQMLGRRGAGTLRLTEDANGLYYEVDLPDTQVGRDTATMVKRGDLYGSSFAFRTVKDAWTMKRDGPDMRELMDVDLRDVSVVADPAYEDTSVAIRGYSEHTVNLSLMKMRLDLALRL